MARNTFRTDEVVHEDNKFNLRRALRLKKYVLPYKRSFIITLAFTIVSSALGLLGPYLTMIIMDRAIPDADVPLVLLIAGFMLLTIAANIFFMRYRMDAMAKVGQGIIRDLRTEIFVHLQRLPFSFFDSRPHGKILVRVVNYINSLSDMLSNGLINVITDLFSLVIIVVFMLSISPRLTLVAMAGVPLLMIASFFIRIKNRRAWQIFSAKQSNLNAYIHESIAGVKITQSFSREAENKATFAEVSGNVQKAWLYGCRVMFLLWPSVENIGSFGVAFLYVIGVSMIANEVLTIGVLVAFVAYIWRFWMPINNMANFYNTLVTNMANLELIFETIDEPVLVKDKP
ncbi:MAG: ABC transporter ATP-binding protein, partial [Defluviitaleaceae bacterium]|nr:ABC transporter ATP-binding protein [Defluviitaleaceae bacterium]